MEQVGVPASVTESHTYRTSWRSGWAIGFWLFEVAFLFLLQSLNREPRAHALAFALIAGTMLTWWVGLRAVSLSLGPRGIVYRTLGRVSSADWSDIERLGHIRPLIPWERSAGLVVRTPSPHKPRFRIPLAPFDSHWREGAIGGDIHRYAPWLVAGGGGDA